MGMRAKILASFGIIMLVFTIVGVFNLVSFISINNAVEEIVERRFVVEQKVQKGHLVVNRIHNRLWDAMLLPLNSRQTQIPRMDRLALSFFEIMDSLAVLYPDKTQDLRQHKRLFQTYYLIGKDILKLPDLAAFQKSHDEIARFRHYKKELSRRMDAMFSGFKKEFADSLTSVRQKTVTQVMVGLAALLTGTLLSIFLSLKLSTGLTRPVLALTGAIRRMSGGDLKVQAKVESEDEIGHLSAAFNTMASRLNNTLEDLKSQINERRLAEEELRFRNTILTTQQETSLDGILVLDNQEKVVSCNHRFEKMWALPLAVSQGKEGEMVFKAMVQCLTESEKWAERFKEIRRNTKEHILYRIKLTNRRVCDGYVSPLVGPNRENFGQVWYFTDITRRLRAEEKAGQRRQQLVQADKMASLGILVSGMAHEINNPNQFIASHLEPLKKAWEGALPILDQYHNQFGDFKVGGTDYALLKQKMPSIFNNMAQGSSRIKIIVSELRNYVQNQPPENTDEVQINQVIDSALTLVSNMVKKATSSFSIEKQEDLPKVKGNYQRLEQVLVNLIQNACQALPSREKGIKVCTRYDPLNRKVMVLVHDQGQGIAPEHLDHVTDPFFTTKREQGGTGLGLAISSRIIMEHKGRLNVNSVLGEGTVMRITLPVPQ